MSGLVFETQNYLLRPLSQADITPEWGRWLAEPANARLLNAEPRALGTAELQDYLDRFDNDRRVLLGIFHKPSATHIGLFTSTTSASGDEVLWNTLIGDAAYRSVGGLLEIKQLRVLVAEHFFVERGYKAAYASVAAHNTLMMRYLASAGWEPIKRSVAPSRVEPNGPVVELVLFRLTAESWMKRAGSWVRTLKKKPPTGQT